MVSFRLSAPRHLGSKFRISFSRFRVAEVSYQSERFQFVTAHQPNTVHETGVGQFVTAHQPNTLHETGMGFFNSLSKKGFIYQSAS